MVRGRGQTAPATVTQGIGLSQAAAAAPSQTATPFVAICPRAGGIQTGGIRVETGKSMVPGLLMVVPAAPPLVRHGGCLRRGGTGDVKK